ncbi:putative tyrosine-protein kinase, active [Plasmopara halstedii]
MLTALKYWHGCGYCHGDIRWRNIVLVPTSGFSYWVLIDMDESRQLNTTTIRWKHRYQGHKLRFQHDLCQLGQLMGSFPSSYPTIWRLCKRCFYRQQIRQS